MKKVLTVLLIALLIVAVVAGGYWFYLKSRVPAKILTFEDCANAGYLVVDTIPRECHAKNGQFYIEADNHKALLDYIVVTNPQPNSIVTSPFKVEGQAKGVWFGENKLVIKLTDLDGHVIAEKPMYALSDPTKGDAMVSFTGAFDFPDNTKLERGKLLIEKASAVDIPGKNGPLVIPLRFK
jgi:hypothetical protein